MKENNEPAKYLLKIMNDGMLVGYLDLRRQTIKFIDSEEVTKNLNEDYGERSRISNMQLLPHSKGNVSRCEKVDGITKKYKKVRNYEQWWEFDEVGNLIIYKDSMGNQTKKYPKGNQNIIEFLKSIFDKLKSIDKTTDNNLELSKMMLENLKEFGIVTHGNILGSFELTPFTKK